jgi:putative sterol carrier protein
MDKKHFAVKMLMGAIQYAAVQLAELDDSFKQKLAGIDSVTQWKIEPSGPNSYTIVKDRKVEYKMDAIHDNPTYTLSCDLDTALELFQGKLDANNALVEGKVKIDGDLEKAQKETFILETLGEYLSDISGGG